MSAVPQHHPEDDPSNLAPARMARVMVDDLGITLQADLRITGVLPEVRDLFASTPFDQHAALVERALTIGATNLASTVEISANDAARMKLVQAVEAMIEHQERAGERQDARDQAITEKIDAALKLLTTQVDASSRQEIELRKQIKDGQAEVVKAAKQLNTTREELEKNATEAITKLTEAQTKAREAIVKGTEASLRKLMDKSDPMSAPALITGIMDKAATDMRTTTSKNIDGLVKDLTKQFGESSPLVEKIAKTVREGAEAEIKHATEQVEKPRSELLEQRTRTEHSPVLRGDSYEEDVLDLVSHGASVYGWTVERTGTEVGGVAGSKKGDHLITDEDGFAVAAIEARARKGVSARVFHDGLRDTARNRGTKIVLYLARTPEDLPSGLGEFSRGRLPLHYKQLGDGVHALTTVIDPSSETVAERLAMTLWFVHRLREQLPERGTQADAVTRIAEALPWVQQIVSRLGMFTAIKTGLTKSTGEISKVRDKVTELEATLGEELETLEQVLWGDQHEGAEPEVA
jgi:hypothetical protein